MKKLIGVLLITFGIRLFYVTITRDKEKDKVGFGLYLLVRAYSGAIAAIVLGLIFIFDL